MVLIRSDQEFVDTPLGSAPLGAWQSAGLNVLIDSVFVINVASIPDSISYLQFGVYVPIPDAQTGEGFDNSLIFNQITVWLSSRLWLQGIHSQIYIPPGVYNFSEQIAMHSNISLKGAGSNITELRFLIKADSTSTI